MMPRMDTKQLDSFRARLTSEREKLEEALAKHGNKQEETGDWQGASDDSTPDADPNIVSDQIEELVSNVPLVEELEAQYREVKKALEKMDAGTYGICDVCGDEIPIERLEANPAATTCIAHAA